MRVVRSIQGNELVFTDLKKKKKKGQICRDEYVVVRMNVTFQRTVIKARQGNFPYFPVAKHNRLPLATAVPPQVRASPLRGPPLASRLPPRLRSRALRMRGPAKTAGGGRHFVPC